MPVETHPLIGRAAELARVDRFLDAIGGGCIALLVEGDPGIGKTSLWRHAVDEASRRQMRVLACRPTESETGFSYAALGDLLSGVALEALAGVPDPQRRALDIALLRSEPDDGQGAMPQAVSVGTLGVLRALAEDGPLLIAIDDVQWLDHPTWSALSFVARRLQDERIGFCVARRGEATGVPLDLDAALPPGRFEVLHLGELELPELERLLADRLGGRLTRPMLARLQRASGGNPFFALEIGRAMLAHSRPAGGELPIPANLHDLVGDRLAQLPPHAREAVEIAAALSRPTRELIAAAMDGVAARDAVEAAIGAGVIESDGERVRFTHPLLASAAYARIQPAARRELHGRLAALLGDSEERARHLARASAGPDAEVALVLDEAARRATRRGAPDAAGELWEQARRLTPPEATSDAWRRGMEAGERYFESGDIPRARALFEELRESAQPGRQRARTLARLGWVQAHGEGLSAATDSFLAALAEQCQDDVALRIELEDGLAWCLHSTDDLISAEAHARTALELAEELGEPTVLSGALAHLAMLESLRGEGLALDRIERALELGHAPSWSQILGRPDWIRATLLQWEGRLDESRECLAALHDDALERGDEHALPSILFQLARVELLCGDWVAARKHARECRETTLRSGAMGERPYALAIGAMVAAHLGEVESATEQIREGLRLAGEHGVQPAGLELLATRGFLELSQSDVVAADRTLSDLHALALTAGFREPAVLRYRADQVEAAIANGRIAEAGVALAELEHYAETLGRASLRAVAGRCRALLLAHEGDLDAARVALEAAARLHETSGEPFERARTQLVLGTVERRDRKKLPARVALEAALATFDELGAALWSERARAELERVQGTSSSASGLTPTEERVAQLIADGRSYREVADAMFISPRTVQWNLSKVYRKLGIRSRAEPPARLAADPAGPGDMAGSPPA